MRDSSGGDPRESLRLVGMCTFKLESVLFLLSGVVWVLLLDLDGGDLLGVERDKYPALGELEGLAGSALEIRQ